jgi:hypothetical protein
LTNETYAILLFALGGVAGGVLGSIGQDIWNEIKQTCAKIFRRKSAKRNVLEVAMRFENLDVVFHFENRNAGSLPAVLDEADSILIELQNSMKVDSHTLKSAKAIELRQIPGESDFECVLHSFRKGDNILRNLTKQTRMKNRVKKRPKKSKKTEK